MWVLCLKSINVVIFMCEQVHVCVCLCGNESFNWNRYLQNKLRRLRNRLNVSRSQEKNMPVLSETYNLKMNF